MDSRPGQATLRVTGRRAEEVFRHEPGGHRWQRVPPTEKRGRVHTSTVTVAVLPEPDATELRIAPSELDETFTRGSGKGGQHRNKTSTCVVLVHRPTRLRVRIDGGRCRERNREEAKAVMRARLMALQQQDQARRRESERRRQVGSGMRGDKVRTVQVQHGTVVDHRTGKRARWSRYRRGDLSDLR